LKRTFERPIASHLKWSLNKLSRPHQAAAGQQETLDHAA
jgi:hypothetical protein